MDDSGVRVCLCGCAGGKRKSMCKMMKARCKHAFMSANDIINTLTSSIPQSTGPPERFREVHA